MKLLGNFIIATLLIVMGCSTEIEPVNPFDPETSPNNKAKGGISGRINPEDIKDLKKITFTVTITDSQFNAIVSEDGTFRFNELPQGNYFLKVIASDKSYKEEQIGPFEVKPGQTVYAGTIPLILKKGLIRGSFVTTSGNNLKNPAAFIPVFIGKSEEKKKINLLLTDSKDRCASDTATEGYITSTDGSGRIRIDNIRVGKYRAILSDDSAGIGISQEFEIREDRETDIGEITVMPPGALLHIEDTDAAGVAIDVTAKNKVRVVFGLQNFSGEAMVYADGSPETAEWKDISNTNYSEITIPGEGIVPIYVKFRDIFCRESPVFRTSVYRDISLPVIKGVSIDDIVKEQDSEYSKSSTIKIHIDATDDYHNFKSDFSDMKMKITTENPENTEWEDFNTEKDYYLGEQDGEKLLRILLKDKAGNVSETFVKNIILDKTPPKNVLMQISGKVLDINGNYTEHNSLTLISTVKFRFESDSFGGKVFLYGKSGSQQTTCDIAMENGKTINLIKTETGSYAEIEEEIKGEDGEKSYIACFADTAGNIRSTPETATIYLDRSPPSNVMFRINNGNNYSTSGEIKITNITAYDNYHGNMYIKVSGCPDFSDSPECKTTKWLTYENEIIWDSGGKEGTNEIFLKVRDSAGNESATAHSFVNIDLTDPEPPTSLSVQGKSENNIIYANTTMPVIMWNPSSSSDTEYYEIQIKRDIDTNYMSFKVYGQNFIPPSLSERRYNFRIRTFDKSGRSSNYAIGPDFIIDTTVPTTPRFEKINYSIVDLNDSDYNELKIRLAVLSSDTNFKEYKIKGGVYSEFIPVQPDNYNYVKFYLLKDSVNNLQIKAVDRAGNESSTDYIVITEDSRVPLPPSDIRVIEGNGRIYVKWTPSASKDVAGYRLYYGFTDKPPFAGSFAAEGVSPINAGLNTVIGLSYLINFTKFYVTVTAYDKTENIFHESIMPQAVPVYPTPISIEPAGKYTENHKALKLYFYEDNLLLLDGEGIRFYDITEPTKPIITGKYNDNEPISSIGHYSCKPPCKPKGEIYLGKSGYIDIIEIKNGAHLKSRIATAHLHTFIFVYQDYLISAIDRDGFKVYSYTDENSLEELGSFEAGKIITSAYLKDDYLFYVETTDYSKYMLHITDISDPLNVKKVSSFKIGGYSKWINIVNNRLYTAYPSTEFLKDEMLVLDISDLKNPKMLGTYKGNMMNMGDADGSYVFLLDSTDGLVILDQSRLPDFQKVTSLNRFNLATDIKARSNFLYISDDYNGLAVVDVSNVYQPSVVFSEKFDRFEPSDVAVQGAYAYLSNKTPPKIVILDISNPGNIKKKGELPLSNSPEGLFIHGNELYIANGTKGLTIADVSEPLSPKIIGNLGNITISRVYYSNGYVFALGVNSFYSIDVKNPKTPVLKGSITTLTDPKKFVVRGRVAYIADGSGGLKAVNLNNPDSPVLANTFSNGANIVDVLISGKKIIIAEESGLRILEVNNISNPTTFNQLGNFRINGITNTIAMSGPYVYLLGSVSGLWIIDINNPQANLLCPDSQYCKGFLEIPSRPNKSMFVDGTMIYLAQEYEGLETYEISSPTIPLKISTIKSGNQSHYLQNGFLFLTDSSSIKSYDITDIQNPTLRGSYSSLNSPKSLAVTGNYLFTTEYSNTGIKIFDITDPSTILWVPSAPFNFNNSTNISIYGRTMFLSHPTSVKIIEFTTPYDITIASEIPTINNQRVVQQGRYIFIPNWQYGMTIYDISDKTKPKMISTYQTKDAISAVDVRGDYAFLAAGYEGLIILDIKDVSNPIEVSSFYNDNILPVYGVKVFNNIAYLACSKKGFAIINIKDPKNPYLIAKFEEGYSFADDISVYGNIAFIQARSEIQILNIEP